MSKPITLKQLLAHLPEETTYQCIGISNEIPILGLCSKKDPKPHHITYIDNLNQFSERTNDQTIYLVPNIATALKQLSKKRIKLAVLTDAPHKVWQTLAHIFLPQSEYLPSIKATAKIATSAHIAKTASIGDYSIIGENAFIGEHVKIGEHVTVESNCCIGDNTQIDASTCIYKGTIIGKHVKIAANTTIGSPSFAYQLIGGSWQQAPQLGNTVIHDHVHIGANSCIDRGNIDATCIHQGVIIDNHVHIGHDVEIGQHTAIAAFVAVAGATSIGKYCRIAGKAGINSDIKICDYVQINAAANVMRSIKHAGIYAGAFPAMQQSKWNRITVYIKKLGIFFKKGDFYD